VTTVGLMATDITDVAKATVLFTSVSIAWGVSSVCAITTTVYLTTVFFFF
jgi:hypothetical protein